MPTNSVQQAMALRFATRRACCTPLDWSVVQADFATKEERGQYVHNQLFAKATLKLVDTKLFRAGFVVYTYQPAR